jgi:hypothetical protein
VATKTELIEEVGELSAALNQDVLGTDRLTHDQLTELVRDLKAKKTDAETVTAADEPAADEPAADEPAADEPAADEPAADEPAAVTIGFAVAPGKAITTKRGILGGGEPVTVRDLGGGQGALDALLDKGFLQRVAE